MAAYTLDTYDCSRSLGYLTKRLHRDLTAVIEPLFADAELSFSQWAAMMSIAHRDANTCAALSRDIGHDMGATSRMIAGLEERKLIVRERSEDDRRVVRLSLTRAGHDLADLYRGKLANLWNIWLADWSDADVETLIGGLQRLQRTMDRVREAGA